MFEIEYKGGNSVVISTKKSKIIADPKLSLIGLSDLAVKNAIEIVTEDRLLVSDTDARLIIAGPGEYEIGELSIRGIPAMRHIDTATDALLGTIYRINIGEVRLVVFGNVAANLTEEQLEAIGVVDMAILPVGGNGYTLDHVEAARIARQIDAKVVIPVHFADSELTYEVPQDSIDLFVAELGSPVEMVPKYRLKAAVALPVAMTIVQIRRS